MQHIDKFTWLNEMFPEVLRLGWKTKRNWTDWSPRGPSSIVKAECSIIIQRPKTKTTVTYSSYILTGQTPSNQSNQNQSK